MWRTLTTLWLIEGVYGRGGEVHFGVSHKRNPRI